MAFKRSAVRSRLSPPRIRTHVAEKVHESLFYSKKNLSGYLILNCRAFKSKRQLPWALHSWSKTGGPPAIENSAKDDLWVHQKPSVRGISRRYSRWTESTWPLKRALCTFPWTRRALTYVRQIAAWIWYSQIIAFCDRMFLLCTQLFKKQFQLLR